MAFRPTLPPKAGYIEIEENGERKYKRVYTEAELEAEALMLQVQMALAELAEAQAVDQTATELALAELAEIVLGG